jgi:hypothetical protein
MTDERTLEEKAQYLLDRQEFADVIAQHARGHDRHDVDLLTATYHDDGIDEHGHAINAGTKNAEWANATHRTGSASHLHNLTTHSCEIDGDTAHAESYVMVVLLSPDETSTSIMNGRYVDRLERRDGAWRLAVRRATVDAVATGDATMLGHPFFREQGYIRGTRDRTDVSYQRPLSLDGPEPARWGADA